MEIKDIDLYSAAYNQPFFIASGSEHFELPNVERKSFSEYFNEVRDNQSERAVNRFTASESRMSENTFQSTRNTSFHQETTINYNDYDSGGRSINDNSLQKESVAAEKESDYSADDTRENIVKDQAEKENGAAQESKPHKNDDDEIEEQDSSQKEAHNQSSDDTGSNSSTENQQNQITSTDEKPPVNDGISTDAIAAAQTLESGALTAASDQVIEQVQLNTVPTETLPEDKGEESLEKSTGVHNQTDTDARLKPEPLPESLSTQSTSGKESIELESKPAQNNEMLSEANMAKTDTADKTTKEAKQDNAAQSNVQNYADIVQNNSSLSNNSENYQENPGFLGQKTPDSIINTQNSEPDEASFKTSLDSLKSEMNVSLENVRSSGGTEKADAQSVDKEINMPRYSDVRFDEKELLQHIQSKIQTRNFDGIRHSEMNFRLNPDSLGSLSLKLVMDNETLTAKIKVDNNNVRQIIEGNLIELRKSLQTQGVKVEKVEVSLRNDMEQPSYSPQGETGNNYIKQRGKQFINRFGTRNSGVEGMSHKADVSTRKQRFHDGQLDYLI